METLLLTQTIELIEKAFSNEQSLAEQNAAFVSLIKCLKNDPGYDSDRAGEYLLVTTDIQPFFTDDCHWPNYAIRMDVTGLHTHTEYAKIQYELHDVSGSVTRYTQLAALLEAELNRPEMLRNCVRRVKEELGDTKCHECEVAFATYGEWIEHSFTYHSEHVAESVDAPIDG